VSEKKQRKGGLKSDVTLDCERERRRRVREEWEIRKSAELRITRKKREGSSLEGLSPLRITRLLQGISPLVKKNFKNSTIKEGGEAPWIGIERETMEIKLSSQQALTKGDI